MEEKTKVENLKNLLVYATNHFLEKKRKKGLDIETEGEMSALHHYCFRNFPEDIISKEARSIVGKYVKEMISRKLVFNYSILSMLFFQRTFAKTLIYLNFVNQGYKMMEKVDKKIENYKKEVAPLRKLVPFFLSEKEITKEEWKKSLKFSKKDLKDSLEDYIT